MSDNRMISETNISKGGLSSGKEDRPAFLLVSLGCDKNLSDSEMMMGLLSQAGYRLTDDENDADVIVVNTCCFIMDAKEESINTLIRYGELKKDENSRLKCLIAAGCLAERYADEIKSDLPEVDAVLGTASFDDIVLCVDKLLSGESGFIRDKKPLSGLIAGLPRVHTGDPCTGYLKIAEGCDKNCTYCIIPKIRGHYRSIPMETLLAEAEVLSDGGVKELILVAQETTIYGTDIYGHKALPELLRKLSELPFEWIRILYCYPEEIDDELIEEMASNPKICHYLDLPIQHSEDGILKRMNRRATRAGLSETVDKLRKAIPDICLRTTLITGFPGETEDDFEGLKSFVKEMRFDRLGVFPYSAEEGTAAETFEDQVDEAVKKSRADEIMEIQQDIAFEKAASRKGLVLDCMVIGRLPEEGVTVMRSYMDAPDIDGFVFAESDNEFVSGTMLTVRITGSEGYDLYGEIV